ncbi:MAG: TolC family protein, partial [Lentisphaeraceae bacterium]|nr:TolC family protein [Lentisphaeraceae bacterium]
KKLALCSITALLSSCANYDLDIHAQKQAFNTELAAAKEERKVQLNVVYSLDDLVVTGLNNSWESMSLRLSEAAFDERSKAQLLKALPRLTATWTATNRSKKQGSSSEGFDDGLESLRSSTSLDNKVSTFKLEGAVSVLDMGLSLLNSEYEKDQTRLKYLERKTLERKLVMNIVESYYSVAAAQYVIGHTKDQLHKNKKALAEIEILQREQHISRFELVKFKRKFLETQKQLREYERSYRNLSLNLSSLVGFVPFDSIKVKTNCFEKDKFDRFTFPYEVPTKIDIENTMLENREEFYAGLIEKHMQELLEDQDFLRLFPNASLFLSYNENSNSFLVNKNWLETGLTATFDLLQLPSKLKTLSSRKKEVLVQKYKNIASAFSILAQVRVNYSNLEEVADRLQYRENIYALSRQELDLTREAAQIGQNKKLSIIEKEIDFVINHIQRVSSLANYFVAYHRLLNSTGAPYIPTHVLSSQRYKTTLVGDPSKFDKEEETSFYRLVKESGSLEIKN